MRSRVLFAAASLTIAAAPAAAQTIQAERPVAIGFAPPLDRLLRYETVQTRPVGATSARFMMVEGLRFGLAPGGYRLDVTLLDHSVEAPPAIRPVFEAGMRPFEGVVISFAVSLDGATITPVDAGASWTKMIAALDRMAAALDADPGVSAETMAGVRGYLASLRGFTPAQRNARLSERAAALTAFAGWPHPPGEPSPWEVAGESPLGPLRVRGTLRLDRVEGGRAHFIGAATSDAQDLAVLVRATLDSITTATPPAQRALVERLAAASQGLSISETSRTTVALATGLVIDSTVVRRTSIMAANGPVEQAGEETTRLLP